MFVHNGMLDMQSFVKILANELSRKTKVYVTGYSRSSGLGRVKVKNPWINLSLGNKTSISSLILMLVKSTIHRVVSCPDHLYKIGGELKHAIRTRENIGKMTLSNYVHIYQPDIIHIQWATHLKAFHSILLDTGRSTKIVVSWRGRLINITPNVDGSIADYYTKFFPYVDGFHAVSNAIKIEGLKWVDSHNTRVIFTGLDGDVLSESKKSDYGINESFKIVSTGRFHWKKGYNLSLIALRRLLNCGYDIHYTIIARGYSEEIEFLIDSLDLNRNVSVCRNLSQKQVYKILKTNDLFLLPSVEEGIANSALEAMCLGLPVLSSDCGGMNEAIQDGKNGILFRNTDVDDLVERLVEFFSLEDEERSELANNAMQTINSHFLPDRLGNEMVEFYRTLLR